MNYHSKSSFKKINEPWHIPRASLNVNGSISGHSHRSNSISNPSSIKHGTKQNRIQLKNRGYYSEGSESYNDNDRQRNIMKINRKIRDVDKINDNPINCDSNSPDGIKRGSHSSQGSTASNHSSHSASSGTYLLTAANLKQLAQVHTKNPLSIEKNRPLYNTNITLQSSIEHDVGVIDTSNRITNDDTVISVDSNRVHNKTKDIDTMSMASSTHFTMVNGVGGPQRAVKEGICSRGHQITVLILTMSLMFLIGIMCAVFMLEMRAKNMPH